MVFALALNLPAQTAWFGQQITASYDGAWGNYPIDLDLDGDIDLVTAAYDGDEITWWENDGTQQFTEHNLDNFWNGACEVHAGDLDGDGDMDVLGVAYHSDEVAWYENDGEMNFTKYFLVGNYDGAHFVRMYDVDGDHDMDIVTCALNAGLVTWWENTGYPNFTRHDIDNTLNGVRQFEVFDLDNDGDADILAGAEGVDLLVWYENDGSQVFQRHIIQSNYSTFWVGPYDFNNDGAWDILACAAGNDDISWFENDGSMNFTRHSIDGNVNDPQSVAAADFDQDGDLDIVAASRYLDVISWWENDQNTYFTQHHLSQYFDYAVTVSVTDLDQDGDTDIVGAAYYTNNIGWWQNLTILVPGIVSGVVTNNYGAAVESVFVDPQIVDIHDYTDQYGNYELALPPAMFNILFQKEGYYDYTALNVIATAGNTTTLDVTIEKIPSGFVDGNVIDEYGLPLNDAYVFAENTGFGDSTDINGDYIFEVTTGTYDITFTKPGYYDTTISDVEITLDDTVTHNAVMYLEMPGIWGRILNKEPWPVEDVLVSVVNTPISVFSNYNGVFTIEGLPQGVYDILFQHPRYFDTTFTGITIEPGPWDTLYVSLVANGAITGFVGDQDSLPLPDVQVSAVGTNLSDTTDGSGQYFVRIVPEKIYSIRYLIFNYYQQILSNVSVAIGETLTLDPIYLQSYADDVVIWYGNLDLSPVVAPIGDTIMLDVYAKSVPEVGFIILPLGTDDQYIVDHHSVEEGQFFYPLTEWDDVRFLTPWEMSPGWHSQSILGFYDIAGPANNPPLQSTDPIRIASYAFEIANDTSLIGDTVSCLTAGYDLANGYALLGDINGVDPYYPYQNFSPFYFVAPDSTEINVWYGDPDSSIISAAPGETIFLDVYVQSSEMINLDSLHLPLATDDQYISGLLSDTSGIFYYPLTDWDNISFLPANELPPGWHSQSLFGVSDTGGIANPYLQCTSPTRIASFALRISPDLAIVGDTADCLMAGSHPVYGGPFFRDSVGIYSYYPNQFFPSIYFTEPPVPDINVWYGNSDGSILSVPIGVTIPVDVYIQASEFLNIDSLHLALGTDNQYIVGHHSVTAGSLYTPLTSWDHAQFLPPNALSPGWQSQSLYAFADTGGDPNPYLQCPTPTRIASFALEIVNDNTIVGDTAECLIPGLHTVYGGSFVGDSANSGPFYPNLFFSPFHFTAAPQGDCEYVVGDANNTGDFNGLDVTFGVNFFKGGNQPPYECECTPGDTWYVAGDVNGSCNYNGLDITYAVAYLKGGPALVPCSDCPPAIDLLPSSKLGE